MNASSSVLTPRALDQRRRRVAHQHPARMHQRDPVAALGLVHEMGGDEDGDLVPARQIDHDLPEGIPRHRVHPRGRLVEDQHLRPVDHGHRQGQPLALPKRQGVGQALHDLAQAEALRHLLDPGRDPLFRHSEQPGMQHQVLPDRQLAVERKGLGHVADTPAGVEIVGVHRLAEQPGLPFAGRQQAGQHLHGGGLAAAV